ncbi:MAG: hypothetical protein Q7K43_05560 [Candidatus Woesearchaeota archaeon]|nr:hypothetical protein [Candidatus Woesearchaeota archaeon]
MPVPMRIWFINRLQRELAQDDGNMKHATPEERAYMGSNHPYAPKKLKR